MYQRIVDNLSLYLDSDDRTLSPPLAEDMAAYAQACAEVNERLRRCNDLLGRGLRAEALHFAEAEPNLLQAVSALDFPRWKELAEVAVMYELPRPPGLLMETAIALNAAYSEHAPVENLLIRLRTLALNRSPILGRLRILRQLAKIEPTHPRWAADVRAHEKEWLMDCRDQAIIAARSSKREALEEIIDELDSGKLTVTPSAKLRDRVWQQYLQVVHAELNNIALELIAAKDAANLETSRQLRQQWERVAARLGVEIDAGICQKVQRVFSWIEEHDTATAKEQGRQRALDQLKAALFAPQTTVQELEALGREVLRFSEAIPSSVEPQYRERLRVLRQKIQRRRIVTGCLASAMVLTLVFFVVWKVRAQQRATLIADTAANLTQLERNGDLRTARAMIDALASDIAKAGAVATQIRAIEKAEQKEKNRVADLEHTLRALREAPLYLPPTEEMLHLARQLAANDQDRIALADVLDDRERRAAVDRADRDKKFGLRIEELAKEIEQLESLGRRYPATAFPEDRLKNVRLSLTDLIAEQQKVNSPSLQRGKELQKRSNVVEQLVRWLPEEAQLRQALSKSLPLSDWFTNYVVLLTRFAEGSPDTSIVEHRSKVLNEVPLWKSIAAWCQLTAKWSDQPLAPAEAAHRGDACEKFLREHPAFPDEAAVSKYNAYLQDIAAHGYERGIANKDMKKILSDFLVADLTMIITSNGERYYTKKDMFDFRKGAASAAIEYFVDYDGETKRRRLSAESLKVVDQAPQSKFATEAKRVLDQSTPSTWDADILRLLQDLCDSAALDPILKITLIKRIVAGGSRASLPLRETLRSNFNADQHFAGINLDVRWMDPELKLIKTRRDAVDALSRLTNPMNLLEKANALRNSYESAAKRRYLPVGWLWRRDDNTWSLLPFAEVQLAKLGRTDLMVAVFGSGPTGVWRSVGRCDMGNVNLTWSNCAEGRPVFIRVDAPAAKR